MSVEEHKSRADELAPLQCAVITVSDTRTLETDHSGQEICRLLEEQRHEVVERTVVPDEPSKVRRVFGHWLTANVDVVLLNGGTGISPRDGTVEVVRESLDRELPGFGEIFRYLSYKQVRAAAMLSRAVGGIAKGKVVFALPGSRKAVILGMEELILPELRHIVFELRK